MATKKPQPAYLTERPQFNYAALDAFLSQPASEAEAPPEPRGMARAVADTGLSFGQGAVQGVRMLTDLAGADNAVSGGLRTVEDYIGSLKSAQAKADQQEAAAILQAAEGAGILDQVIAGAKAFGVAPVQTLAQAAGTSIPTLATALIPGVGPVAAGARMGAALGMGAAQGVGGVKSSIYDEVLQAQTAAGKTPEEAQALATAAQEYAGPNAGQIAIGAGLGAWAGRSGIEGAAERLLHGTAKATPGVVKRVGIGAVAEGIPEAVQGGQEKFATNTALANEGFAVDPMSGVVANATMEGLAGFGMGAAFGLPKPGDVLRADKVPERGPMTRALNEGIIEPAAKKVDAGAPLPPEPVAGAAVPPAAVAPTAEVAPAPIMPPASDPAAIAQREADRPPEPTGEVQPGDILTKNGKPWKSMQLAMREQARRGPEFEIVRVADGLVIRNTQGATDAQPGVDQPAGVPDGAADGAGLEPGGSPGTASSDREQPGRGVDADPVAPVPGGGTAVAVGGGTGPDAALTDPVAEAKRAWSEASQRGEPPEILTRLNDAIVEAKRKAKGGAVNTSPERVEEAPKSEQVAPPAPPPAAELPMGQEPGGKARVVRVNDVEYTLTPEQRTEMERVEAAFKARFDAARTQYEATKNNPPAENPDMGLKSAKERLDAEQKALGMQLSAERRRIVDALTPKERKAKAELDARVRNGDTVQTPEGLGVVTGNNFGKVRVEVNGQTRTFPRNEVTKTDAPQPPAAQAPRAEANPPADGAGAPAAPAAVPEPGPAADVEADGVTYAKRNAARLEQIQKAKTEDEAKAVLQDEYADDERHFEGTTRLERAVREREAVQKRTAAAADAQRQRDADYEAGNWVEDEALTQLLKPLGRGSVQNNAKNKAAYDAAMAEARRQNPDREYSDQRVRGISSDGDYDAVRYRKKTVPHETPAAPQVERIDGADGMYVNIVPSTGKYGGFNVVLRDGDAEQTAGAYTGIKTVEAAQAKAAELLGEKPAPAAPLKSTPPAEKADARPDLGARWDAMTPEARHPTVIAAGWSTAKGTIGPQGKSIAKKSWAEQADSTRKRLGDAMPAEAQQPAATHKDPGEPAEPVTAEVVKDAIKTGVQATGRKPSEMLADLMKQIDVAMASAPTAREASAAKRPTKDSFVRFTVPGDGDFKVVNTKESLEEFRKDAAASPGFKDKGTPPPKQSRTNNDGEYFGVDGGSGSASAAARVMLDEGEPLNALETLEAAGKPMMFGNGSKDSAIPYTDATPTTIEGVDGFVGRGWARKKGASSWWSFIHGASGFQIGEGGTRAEAIALATKALSDEAKRAKLDAMMAAGTSADGGKFKSQDELRAIFIEDATKTQQGTFDAQDATQARLTEWNKKAAARYALWQSIMGKDAGPIPGASDQKRWEQDSLKTFLNTAEKQGRAAEAIKLVEDTAGEGAWDGWVSKAVKEWEKAAQTTELNIGYGVPLDLKKPPHTMEWSEVEASVRAWTHIPAATDRARTALRPWKEAHFEAIKQAVERGWRVPDANLYKYPGLIRSDLSDDEADKASDAMVSAFKKANPIERGGPNDYSSAVQAYRDWGKKPALDLMGFERIPKGNGAFDLRDGNMLVRVEPTDRGKYRASMGSAKSGPNLSEQMAVEWAAAYRAESLRVQAADAKKAATPAPQAAPSAAPMKYREANADAKRLTEETGTPHQAVNRERVDEDGYTVSEWFAEPTKAKPAGKPEPGRYVQPIKERGASRDGQMEMAQRGSRIASLQALNDMVRQRDPDAAYTYDEIQGAANIDAMQDWLSERGRAPQAAEPEAAPQESAADIARRNEFRDRMRAYWDGTATPAIRDYLRAFDAFGADRLERNRVKPGGMSAREWLESYVARQSTWDGGRKTGLTGIQALSKKDLWPTEDGSGERLRKAMLEAVKALKNAPGSNGDLMAEAFMEPKPAAVAEPVKAKEGAPEPETPAVAPMPAIGSISMSLAEQAHRGTSHVPERRAEQERDSFRGMLQDAWHRAARVAGTDPAAVERITEVFQDVADGYRARYTATLQARSRVMSAMIAGPARFPVERNRKRMETERKRAEEADEYLKRGIKRLLRAARGPIDNSPESELERVRLNLSQREEAQEQMKAANVALRKGDDAALEDLGFTPEQIAELKKPDYAGRKGFPDYKLTNNNAEIRRLRERLKSAEERMQDAAAGPVETERAGVKIVEDATDDRLRLIFDGKPSEAVREDLKANGFKWSPKNEAWQRQLTGNARYAAKVVLDKHYPPTRTDEAGNVAMFSRARGRGISTRDAEAVVASIRAALPGAPDIVLLESVDDPKIPPGLRAEIVARGAENDVEGVYYEGKVYAFPSHLASVERAEFVIGRHELRHHGMRTLYRDADGKLTRMGGMLLDMHRRNPALRRATKAMQRNRPDTKGQLVEAIEEALADMPVEKLEALTGFDRFVAAVRDWLRMMARRMRAAGLPGVASAIEPKEWTDRDVAAFVLRAEKVSGAGAGPAAFSRADVAPRPASTAVAQLNRVLRGAGWEVEYIDLDLTGEKPKADIRIKRDDGRFLIAKVDSIGRASFETFQRERNLRMDPKNPQSRLSPHIDDTFLGRQRFEGARSMLRSMVNYLVDNATGPVQLADMRAAWAGVMAAPTAQTEALPAPSDEPAQGALFSRASDTLDAWRSAATSKGIATAWDDLTRSSSVFNWWHRTVGTQYHKANARNKDGSFANPGFKAVYDMAQEYLHDTAAFANDPADLAPDLLPQLKTLGDLKKSLALKKPDADKLAAAVFEGTLNWKRDDSGQLVESGIGDDPGVVFTPDELRERFSFNDAQVRLYQQFRKTTDRSLDILVAADVARALGEGLPAPMKAMISAGDTGRFKGIVKAFTLQAKAKAAADLAEVRKRHRNEMASFWRKQKGLLEGPRGRAGSRLALEGELEAEKNALKFKQGGEKYRAEQEAKKWTDLERMVREKYDRIDDLKAKGYAPLMRFGRYTVDVTAEDGSRQFFGMFETEREANAAARKFREAADEGEVVTQGIMSEQAYKQFSGLTPETIELFAEVAGVEKSAIFEEYLRRAKNNRSALKRLIKRTGVAGFSEDSPRVLASFVTSNARAASASMHLGAMAQAVEDIPKEAGDVKDEAIKLREYVQNPQEEAQAIRGLLFAQYLGGSVASALVNMTQLLMMTFPYLSQFGGPVKAAQRLASAMKSAAAAVDEKTPLGRALRLAEKEGIVEPQELHQLQAEASRTVANHPLARRALFAWGGFFSLAERFNRRVSFIAAWNTAQEQKIDNPMRFAADAVAETQGVYNKGNRPNWARGAVGATVLTFKQYSISYMEFLKRLPRREQALALAILVLAAGAQGLPGADDLDDIIDTFGQHLGYDTNAKLWKSRVLADALGETGAEFALRGFSAIPGIPLDVAGRLSLGNMIPGTGLLRKDKTDKSGEVVEALGPAASTITNAVKAIPALLQGDLARVNEISGAVATKNLGKAIGMYLTGEYRDMAGRKVADVTGLDAAVKAIGFQPAEVARDSRRASLAMQQVALARTVEGEIASAWAQGVAEKDPGMVQKARERLAKWNRDNPASRIVVNSSQIRRRVMEMRSTRDERLIKRAPKEMRGSVVEALG